MSDDETQSQSTNSSVLFAAGSHGTRLFFPESVVLAPIEVHVEDRIPKSEENQRGIVDAALRAPISMKPPSKIRVGNNEKSLTEFARGKRRAVILVGDLSRPAPYEIALPAVVAALVEAEIRPSRIAFVACPGGFGPLLGRSAIHRYGEEICGNHELIAWPAEGTPGALFDSADLRIAVAPIVNGDFANFIPKNVTYDFELGLALGHGTQIDIESAHAYFKDLNWTSSVSLGVNRPYDVSIVSGGGSPWEETLEEALLSLHGPYGSSASTTVLVFSGSEGLGSSRFARDVWNLIEQAEEVLAAGKSLGSPSAPNAFDPANVLAECLKRYKQTVLFSREFAEHAEGEDLIERLEAAPHVAARLNLCRSQPTLWNALELLHGPSYSLDANPLGWRA